MSNSKEERLQSLSIGNGIQYLLNEAYKILGNPILTHDMDYLVIAYTENIVTDDPIWNEFITTGTVDFSRLEFYKDENFLEEAANARSVTVLRSNKLKYDRIFGKLINGENIQVGCACIVEACKPFDDNDSKLFELFCEILNKEIVGNEYYLNLGQTYQESLINKLIEGNIEDKGIYTAHVESIYRGLGDYLNLAVVYIAQEDSKNHGLPYYRDLFKRMQPAYKYSVYDRYIVIIMSTDDAVHAGKGMDKLYGAFEQNNMRIGISGCFDNLFELRKYYIEALDVLKREYRLI